MKLNTAIGVLVAVVISGYGICGFKNQIQVISAIQREDVKLDSTLLKEIGFADDTLLIESFNPQNTNYKAIVKDNKTSVAFNYVANGKNIRTNNPNSTMNIYMDGKLIKENVNIGFGNKNNNIEHLKLEKGNSNIMSIVVKDLDGNQKTYTIDFEREGSDDNVLKEIGFAKNARLTESFNENKKEYKAIVSDNNTSMSFHYTLSGQNIRVKDPYASMDIYMDEKLIKSDVGVGFGNSSNHIGDLKLEKSKPNIMKIVVTAEDNSKSVYTIDFDRQAFNDSQLKEIGFADKTKLSPNFISTNKDYIGLTDENQTSIKFNYGIIGQNIRVQDPYASMNIYINDKLIKENVTTGFGSSSAHNETLTLDRNKTNIMKIVVTAESGQQSTYTVKFEEKGDTDNLLKEIGFKDNTELTQPFNQNKNEYIALVKGNDTFVNFEYDLLGKNISVNNNKANMDIYLDDELIKQNVKIGFGSESNKIEALQLKQSKPNIMKIVVTAKNGDKNTYTIDFEREGDYDPFVNDISIDGATLTNREADTYTFILDRYNNLSVSNILLRDEWASCKVLLDKKEVSLDEKFDLPGELAVKVTTNNNKVEKEYNINFTKSDNKAPEITTEKIMNVTGIDGWTSENIQINVSATDESGIKYIKLPDGSIVESDKALFTISENGIYKFVAYDMWMNETIETIEIKEIDTVAPIIESEIVLSDDKSTAYVTVTCTDENSGVHYLEDAYGKKVELETYTFTISANGEYKVVAYDKAGNSSKYSISIKDLASGDILTNSVPVISASDKEIFVGDKFDPLKDISANDKEDGDITENIKVVHNDVDVNKTGVYAVKYEVEDSDGAKSTKDIKVVVKTKDNNSNNNGSNNNNNGNNNSGNNNNSNNNNNNSNSSNDKDKNDNPKTGDSSILGMGIACVLSVIGLVVVNKKKQ